MEYKEEDYLLLSGIQHFAFCRRQWALIHIEQQWTENIQTFEGRVMHNKAHDPTFKEKRGNIITYRAMRIFSRSMGVSGECDIVEFHKDENGIPLSGYDGKFVVYPIEYKRGKPKSHDADILQLTAQAMCLEEMLEAEVSEGCIFYGETRRREPVRFTEDMRTKVRKYFLEMHEHYRKQYTPKVKTGSFCKSCSLQSVCIPQLNKNVSAKSYIDQVLEEI